MATKTIHFKTKIGRLHYIKKKAEARQKNRYKTCHKCGSPSMYYAYLKHLKMGACQEHKDALQPILRHILDKISDQRLLEEFGISEENIPEIT